MTLDDLTRAVADRRPLEGTYIVGVTGSVASGKSTLARALADAMAANGAAVELVATDGFLHANVVLEARGLVMKKGFPQSYDLIALAAALTGVRVGPATFPAYSHVTYDLDPARARTLNRPDVLLVEGLALGLDRPPAPGLIDCLIYLDAGEADLEAWFVARFMNFWGAAAIDPTSFYARFRTLDRAGAEGVARAVWSEINLPNLRQHIASVRAHADLVVTKAADHSIAEIIAAPGQLGR